MRPPYTKFRIEGLSCLGGGAASLERALARLPGILEVYVNPATEIAYLRFDPRVLEPREVMASIERAGYRGVELDQNSPAAGAVDSRGRF